jgi:hypothetical protein
MERLNIALELASINSAFAIDKTTKSYRPNQNARQLGEDKEDDLVDKEKTKLTDVFQLELRDKTQDDTDTQQNCRIALKIARTTLGYLVMEDELKKRMDLAVGEIRSLGISSNVRTISKKNILQVEELQLGFSALTDMTYEPRELEILAEKLADICVDIIEDNTWEYYKLRNMVL